MLAAGAWALFLVRPLIDHELRNRAVFQPRSGDIVELGA